MHVLGNFAQVGGGGGLQGWSHYATTLNISEILH